MKNSLFFLKVLLLLIFLSFSFVDLDPSYIKAFGYGSICVSIKGYPEKDKYDASQFDYRDGKFYVKANGRVDLRTILPEGKTYGDLYSSFRNSNSAMHKNVVADEQKIIKVFTSHDISGMQFQFDPWPSNPNELVNSDGKMLNFSNTAESFGWNTAGVKWDDQSSYLQATVGSWLEFAKPGWQMYILETVGWSRECPEKKYWSYDQNAWITPICYELAPPHAYCIVEVK
jgi:hypothetical protein